MLDPNFWQDKSNSKKIIKEKKLYEDLINSFEITSKKLKDLDDLNELASEENNEIIQKEVIDNTNDDKNNIPKDINKKNFLFILSEIEPDEAITSSALLPLVT